MKKPELAMILREKSLKLNLFSTGDREKLEGKHIPDSLAIMEFAEFETKMRLDGIRVLDIGTGGGLPGLALACEFPEGDFTLVDARQKKIEAVNEMITELKLENVEGVSGRFEALARQEELRESFDIVLARAVAPLPTLLEYAAGFLKDGGVLFAWKSSNYKDELESSRSAQDLLGMVFEEAFTYELPEEELPDNDEGFDEDLDENSDEAEEKDENYMTRVILKFVKTGDLDEKFPRRDGVPKAKPL